jgi:hypothetical protein
MGEMTGMLIAMGIVLTIGAAVIAGAGPVATVLINQISEYIRQAGIAGIQ